MFILFHRIDSHKCDLIFREINNELKNLMHTISCNTRCVNAHIKGEKDPAFFNRWEKKFWIQRETLPGKSYS